MRQSIPIVPACEACNGKKSKLEHYLATVLPIAGQHPVAKGIEIETVQNRLCRNNSLRKELDEGYERFRQFVPSQMYITTFRHDDLISYAALIARGLLYYHFDVVLSQQHTSEGRILPSDRSHTLDVLYQDVSNHVLTVNNTIACGAFAYRGFAVAGDLFTSIWHLRLYGGLTLGSSENGLPSPPVLWDLSAKTHLKETNDASA
jgi:hypothetical protein